MPHRLKLPRLRLALLNPLLHPLSPLPLPRNHPMPNRLTNTIEVRHPRIRSLKPLDHRLGERDLLPEHPPETPASVPANAAAHVDGTLGLEGVLPPAPGPGEGVGWRWRGGLPVGDQAGGVVAWQGAEDGAHGLGEGFAVARWLD